MTDAAILALLVLGLGLGIVCLAGAIILGLAAWRGEP